MLKKKKKKKTKRGAYESTKCPQQDLRWAQIGLPAGHLELIRTANTRKGSATKKTGKQR